MYRVLAVGLLAMCGPVRGASASAPEGGPENGGLRMRLEIQGELGVEGACKVAITLTNVSNDRVVLRADWPYEGNEGSVEDYIQAAVSFETYPPMAPWIGGILAPNRKSPQPERVLAPGEELTVRWTSGERVLKGKDTVTNPQDVQNPEFQLPGLYAVHATLKLPGVRGGMLLRSNEQLVSVGGGRKLPKYTYGHLAWVDHAASSALLDLGSVHKIDPGDEFLILIGKREAWILTVTEVEPNWSRGGLVPAERIGPNPAAADPRLPERGAAATLMLPDR